MQGVELELPPILLGRYGSDPKKKTVLVYGHYDVYQTGEDISNVLDNPP
jgi:acetylornithine deacetylase/succinyl-diaminopimelate desuccinylase-like protein